MELLILSPSMHDMTFSVVVESEYRCVTACCCEETREVMANKNEETGA